MLSPQAKLVSEELIRVAILWHEQWHEALEEASRLYFAERNVEGMLEALRPMHEKMQQVRWHGQPFSWRKSAIVCCASVPSRL